MSDTERLMDPIDCSGKQIQWKSMGSNNCLAASHSRQACYYQLKQTMRSILVNWNKAEIKYKY